MQQVAFLMYALKSFLFWGSQPNCDDRSFSTACDPTFLSHPRRSDVFMGSHMHASH